MDDGAVSYASEMTSLSLIALFTCFSSLKFFRFSFNKPSIGSSSQIVHMKTSFEVNRFFWTEHRGIHQFLNKYGTTVTEVHR